MQIEKAYLFGRQISGGTPPTPPTPQWWFPRYGTPSVQNLEGITPYVSRRQDALDLYDVCWDIYGSSGTQMGINAIEITEDDLYSIDFPLYNESDGSLSSYKLQIYRGGDIGEFESFVVLCYGDEWVDFGGNRCYWHDFTKPLHFCAGVDTFYADNAGQTTMHHVFYSAIIYAEENGGTFDYAYLGGAVDLDDLKRKYHVVLGSEWYNPPS